MKLRNILVACVILAAAIATVWSARATAGPMGFERVKLFNDSSGSVDHVKVRNVRASPAEGAEVHSISAGQTKEVTTGPGYVLAFQFTGKAAEDRVVVNLPLGAEKIRIVDSTLTGTSTAWSLSVSTTYLSEGSAFTVTQTFSGT